MDSPTSLAQGLDVKLGTGKTAEKLVLSIHQGSVENSDRALYPMASRKILVVDDSPTFREEVIQMLLKAAYTSLSTSLRLDQSTQ